MYRSFLAVLGVILAVPGLFLIVLGFRVPITTSGIGYLLAYMLSVTGLIISPWYERYYLLTLTGMIALGCIAGARLFQANRQSASTNLSMVTLPQGSEARWLSYLIDEQDTLIFGETLFHYIGGDSPGEHENLTAALSTAYTEMRAMHGVVPSPVLNTYLSLQRPDQFDAVVIEPEINLHADTAVVFLHGYMGNVTAQCWEISQAVNRFGAITVCPSTDWTGQWWQPEGEAILQATFSHLREQGIRNFYLGGFSNGGFGISRLAPKLHQFEGLRGLIFIDGIYDGASIRQTGLPVLIIQGTQDERVSATEVQKVAEAIGASATYVELESDHFLIMKVPELVQNAIAGWLEEQ